MNEKSPKEEGKPGPILAKIFFEEFVPRPVGKPPLSEDVLEFLAGGFGVTDDPLGQQFEH